MVGNIKKYAKIYRVFITQFLKGLLEYRVDFFIGALSFTLAQFSGLLFIIIIFNQIPSLDGWSKAEIMLIYGLFQIPRGIDHLFTDPIWGIPHSIISGKLDRHLIRPINPLFQIVAERIDHNAIGELLLGTAILIYIAPQLDADPSALQILIVLCFMLIGSVIYTSIKLLFASISFFAKSHSVAIISSAYGISEFGKYPLTIFPRAIQLILKYVLPFAYTAYYPARYLLGKETTIVPLIEAFVVMSILSVSAYAFWLFGLSKYESAGN